MLLKARGLRKHFSGRGKEVKALDGITLEVGKGEIVAVNGPSGCGKTTLLLASGGLMRPDAGSVILNGEDIYLMPPEKRAAKRAGHIGFVFQQFYLVPYLTVIENVMLPAMGNPGAGKKAGELLKRFNLDRRQAHKPSELSTGERQRTALVRAVINSPAVLLADEPTGNLDDKNAEEVMSYIADFASGGGGVLLVSHDKRTGLCASRTHYMERGKFAG